MRKYLLAAAFAAISLPAMASDVTDVMAVITAYDKDFSASHCAPQTTIVDDFAPHFWQGAAACSDWVAALEAFDKKNGASDGAVALGKPWQVKVTADRAYAVYPVRYTYKLNGKPVAEQGVWSFTLQHLAAGWKITSWTYSQHQDGLAKKSK